jgi:hypothetical protein
MPDDTIPPGEDDPTSGHPESRPARDYEVGYGKPPAHTRFKKGRSGNPRGRPKRSRNLASIFDAALDEKVNGRRRKISKLKAAMKQVVNHALRGDPKATQRLLRLLSQTDAETELGQEPWTVTFIGDDARP